MIVTNAYKYLINRCKLEHDCDDANNTRRGFTLIELVLVLMILAILAGAALSMVDTQVDQARFESTQQTLLNIENAVLGPDNARAADGSRAVSGFVADCGRLPYYLTELYQPVITQGDTTLYSFSTFTSGTPAGDSEVTTTGGWNGPYVKKVIGGDFLREGFGATLTLEKVNGTEVITQYNIDEEGRIVGLAPNSASIGSVHTYGRDNAVGAIGGDTYDADLSMVFEDQSALINRWQKPLTVNVKYYDDNEDTNPGHLRSNPKTSNGETIVVRVYGPVQVPDATTGNIHIGTIGHEDLDYTAETTVSLKFEVDDVDPNKSDLLPIGPRIIRAYQLDVDHDSFESDSDTETMELSEHDHLKAVSLPTRVVVSHETSSIDLILRNVP